MQISKISAWCLVLRTEKYKSIETYYQATCVSLYWQKSEIESVKCNMNSFLRVHSIGNVLK